MPPKARSRRWGRWRIYFRRIRIGVWLLILVLLGAVIYFNQVGLPGFLKKPLLSALRARGVDLQFTRLRWRWQGGLVAENVRFGQAAAPDGPTLAAKQADVRLSYAALARLRLQVESLALSQGQLHWPVPETNRPPRTLAVEDIETTLRLLPGDEWSLDQLRARFAGARFVLSGDITNASTIRDWPFLHAPPTAPEGRWQDELRQFADALEQIHFTATPELRLFVHGDARDLKSFSVHLTVDAPDAVTPWGSVAGGVLTGRLLPATSNETARAEVHLQAADFKSRWADARNLDVALRLASVAALTNLTRLANVNLDLRAARLQTKWVTANALSAILRAGPFPDSTSLVTTDFELHAATLESPWADATNTVAAGHWLHAITNPTPLSCVSTVRLASAQSRWGRVDGFALAAHFDTPTNSPPQADASWAWWTNLQSRQLDWACRLDRFESEKLHAKDIACAGQWLAPQLALTNLHASLYGGALEAQAQLDIATRAAAFYLQSDFDVQQLSPLLPEKGREWLAKLSWATPPHLSGNGSVVLPVWTNRAPDWLAELQPTLCLTGQFAVTNGAYLGVHAGWARSRFSYSNSVWRLPDFQVGLPEGRLDLSHDADERTGNFYWRIRGMCDPHAFRPLVPAHEQPGLDFFTFTQPPVVEGEVWGHSHEPDRTGFQGHVTLTNFTFRGETATSLASDLRYTNRILEFFSPLIRRGAETISADRVTVDFPAQRVYLTNGFTDTDPMVIARAIGPKPGAAIEPFRFTKPPMAHVNGFAPLRGERDADMSFDLAGGPFEWWRFRVPYISGQVRWQGETLDLNGVKAAFYDGAAAGFAHLHFIPEPGTEVQFAVNVTNANFRLLMADLVTRSNHLEGRLNGQIVITNANTDDWRTWNGYGHAQLRDGLIWEIPIFGILSPALDAVMPGLGSTRLSEGSAQFMLTNGVVYSDRLELGAPALRLQYNGAVDLTGRVAARAVAEPLRDAWLVGPIISFALSPVSKIFEFKITGTLDQPKSELIYIPKVLLIPFHPFRTLESLFPAAPGSTNAPPPSASPPAK